MADNIIPVLGQSSEGSTQPNEEVPLRNNDEEVQDTDVSEERGCCAIRIPALLPCVTFLLYLSKLFTDGSATYEYNEDDDANYSVISGMCFVVPTIMYVIYQIGQHLKETNPLVWKDFAKVVLSAVLLLGKQIISHIEIICLSDKVECKKKTVKKGEKKTSKKKESEIEKLDRKSAVLDFFENLYAGLMQLLLQVYIIVITLQNNAENKILIRCIVVSILSLGVTLRAFQRKDDGPKSIILSFIGWGFIFFSKIIAMAMATSVIHYYILVFIGIHAILMSLWITVIAVESYSEDNSKSSPEGNSKSSPEGNSKSFPEGNSKRSAEGNSKSSPEGNSKSSPEGNSKGSPEGNSKSPREDNSKSPMSCANRVGIYLMVLVLFGIPSLCYWPILTPLKLHRRPLIFLIIIFLENAVLFTLWFVFQDNENWSHYETIFTSFIFGGCLLGGIFIALYIRLKPGDIDAVMLYDMEKGTCSSYGLLFDFFIETFRMTVDPEVREILDELENKESAEVSSLV